jgi:hypothetical protein
VYHKPGRIYLVQIVRAILKNDYISEIEAILLRIRDNVTGEIYRDAISFSSSGERDILGSFLLSHTTELFVLRMVVLRVRL